MQLIFYAILFNETPRWAPWKEREFQLFFVEKSKKEDQYHTISKFVQQGEIERLEKLVQKIAEHIKNLDFPDVSHYSQDVHGIRQFEEDILNDKI